MEPFIILRFPVVLCYISDIRGFYQSNFYTAMFCPRRPPSPQLYIPILGFGLDDGNGVDEDSGDDDDNDDDDADDD